MNIIISCLLKYLEHTMIQIPFFVCLTLLLKVEPAIARTSFNVFLHIADNN